MRRSAKPSTVVTAPSASTSAKSVTVPRKQPQQAPPQSQSQSRNPPPRPPPANPPRPPQREEGPPGSTLAAPQTKKTAQGAKKSGGELQRWVKDRVRALRGRRKVDPDTFSALVASLTDEHEIRAYTAETLGEKDEVQEFTSEFLRRREGTFGKASRKGR